ncbi:MAG: transporter substrate-binding domain-containing protein [Deltaproteobacteria bacterium]|nr:transporter substrate-binding domain-containing protein [Deltaproteobacteria bacterium]MBN2688566.1 transporter substrate-binding domain-containing protein [Deltaproteobacteria bacterium]
MNKKNVITTIKLLCAFAMVLAFFAGVASGADLSEIKKNGVLRHLGVAYANFVTGSGDGIDVEMAKLFAQHLGVKYVYVKTSWKDVIGDLTGKKVAASGEDIKIIGDVPVKGDMIANGFTVLPWRQKIVDYSIPMFPTQVWVLARADSPMKPINPSGDTDIDIFSVKALLKDCTIFGVAKTCLDPELYGIKDAGAKIKLFEGNLNDLAPAVINGDADATLLDVPDALIALEKWGGKVKVIGPVSHVQCMGFAFAKTSPRLLEAFNNFFKVCKDNGTYVRLVRKYYPAVFRYYPEFFEKK